MFAKRRRTVVRLFYVLVSLVFVGGGCVDMKVRKLSLAFLLFTLFQKKNVCVLKFENVGRLLSRGGAKEQSLREEREVFRTTTTKSIVLFLRSFVEEKTNKRDDLLRGRKEAVPKR